MIYKYLWTLTCTYMLRCVDRDRKRKPPSCPLVKGGCKHTLGHHGLDTVLSTGRPFCPVTPVALGDSLLGFMRQESKLSIVEWLA